MVNGIDAVTWSVMGSLVIAEAVRKKETLIFLEWIKDDSAERGFTRLLDTPSAPGSFTWFDLVSLLNTDMDRKDGRTKYVLRGEGAGSVFVIDEKTGNIHITKPLDREEKDEYRLIATATDRQTERALEPSSQFIIRVQDINDNPPVFDEGPYSATVPEMANIGTSIIQVTATDADDPTYGNSARLVYTLVQGTLRTAVPDLDRESQDQFLVVLQAKDMGGHLGGLSGTTTVTVRLTDVNDNPPRFTQNDVSWSCHVGRVYDWSLPAPEGRGGRGDNELAPLALAALSARPSARQGSRGWDPDLHTYSFTMNRNMGSMLAIPGAEVGRISASDTDVGENARLEYTILEGETGDTFNITGVNQEAVIVLNKAVDYESRSSYSFSVEVMNPIVDPRFLRRGPFKDRASVRVAVLNADEPPRFSRTSYLMDVSENCPPACTVGRSDPETLFRITPDSGLITTAMELDREREHWHNITIMATQRDNPSQVSRVLVAIETLDLNDNPPELDRQYTTVVQVLRAVDRDEGGNDSAVFFSIPPESRPTASLVLISNFQPMSRSSSSSSISSTLTLYVPLVLRDGTSGLTSSGTVTVSVCPCLRGGARAEERGKGGPRGQSMLPSPGLSTAALLAILACVATLLAVTGLSLSLRRQKRDSLSPLEEDDVRENIITYDDEGGGEADTAAFDIAALQSAPPSVPHSSRTRSYRTLDSRNIRYSQHSQDKARTYSWAQHPGVDPNYLGPGGGAMYGRLCYSSHTLPVLRRGPAAGGQAAAGGQFEAGAAELGYRIPGGDSVLRPDHSLVIQNQAAVVGAMESGTVYVSATELSVSRVSTSDGGTPENSSGECRMNSRGPDGDWVQSQTLPRDHNLVLTCSGSVMGPPEARSPPSEEAPVRRESLNPEAKDYPATLGRGGLEVGRDGPEGAGLLLSGAGPPSYPEGVGFLGDWRDHVGLGGYVLARRDISPQMLPIPGQARGLHSGGSVMGFGSSWVPGMEPRPPYDSVQVYGLEGSGSRAGSLSSLESEAGDKDDWGSGLEDWGPQFHSL
ncbi:hypothetical protein NHX12_004716, partial [Muraenolepis orangiensis]